METLRPGIRKRGSYPSSANHWKTGDLPVNRSDLAVGPRSRTQGAIGADIVITEPGAPAPNIHSGGRHSPI